MILIKTYQWEQNDTFVIVDVTLPTGQIGSKCEINVGKQIVNVSCGMNFLFRIFLQHPIDQPGSKVTVKEHNIIFNLKKMTTDSWTDLKHPLNSNGKVLTQEYLKMLEEAKDELEEQSKDKREKNRKNKDSSVQEQISVEAEKRKKREAFKESEKDQITTALVHEKMTQNKQITPSSESKDITFTNHVPVIEPKQVNIRRAKLPPPRQRNKIKVSFTERVFPTPMRESKQAEEGEWLKKQAMARKRTKDIELELLPHEKETGYLESKGVKLTKNGDYEGAINAFNIALQMFPLSPRIVFLIINLNFKLKYK